MIISTQSNVFSWNGVKSPSLIYEDSPVQAVEGTNHQITLDRA